MKKPNPISGFPEWLPEQKMVEDRLVAQVREVYASHGFVPIETPAVELIETLSSKGVVEREIYTVRRFHAEQDDEPGLGLHFDLTVPFARYVAQHLHALSMPFKRYQLQKVWRGERPQKGRFREFYQFDIDTIARGDLPLACDAEVITVLLKAFRVMNLGPFRMSLNSRKLLHGCYSALGLAEETRKGVITAVDKIHKIGREGVLKELAGGGVSDPKIANRIIDLTTVQSSAADFAKDFSALGIKDELFDRGLEELSTIIHLVPEELRCHVRVDLSLARGLDYYTGVIFETQMTDHPEFGTVSSGGRYDDLASQFTSQVLPGVGGSIGLTRLLDLAFSHNLVQCEGRSTANVLITVFNEEQRPTCNMAAEQLRTHGIATEVYYKSPKLGKQIEFAEGKGMRFVVFLGAAIGPDALPGACRVKDLTTKASTDYVTVEDAVRALRG